MAAGDIQGNSIKQYLYVCIYNRLQEVNKRWSESPFIAKTVGALSPEARDLLDKIFVVDPSKRITVAQILEHPWCAPAPVV